MERETRLLVGLLQRTLQDRVVEVEKRQMELYFAFPVEKAVAESVAEVGDKGKK